MNNQNYVNEKPSTKKPFAKSKTMIAQLQKKATTNSSVFASSTPNYLSTEVDIRIEQDIIGGILLDPNAIERAITEGLEAKHFSLKKHSIIYSAAQYLHSIGNKTDLILVCTELETQGLLEEVGGIEGLSNLVESTVSTVNIDQYAKNIIAKFQKRYLAAKTEEILKKCGDRISTPEEIQQELKALELIPGSNKHPLIQALDQVKTILLDPSIDEIHKEIKINQIKESSGVDWKLWETLRSKINKEIRSIQLELELKSLLLIEDKIKQVQAIQDLSEKYRISIYSIKELLNELKSRNTTPQFESIGLDDLFDEISDAIEYLVPGLLPKGESVILAASPKVGKSLFATDLAFAVATGEDKFLGETCQTGRVLYVSVDESKQSFKMKLSKRGFRKADAHNLKIITQFCVSQLHKLEEEIDNFRPALVIIDSLKRITKGLEISENSAEFADNIYSISELCNRYGASCVLVHHTNKNSESTGVENVRGSSAIAGALGNVWVMSRVPSPDPNNKKKMIFDPKDPRRQIYCYSRDSEGKAYNLEFNPENNSWTVAGQVGVSEDEEKKQKTIKERILSIMRANLPYKPEGVSGNFIYDCLELEQPGGISKSSMFVNLNRLVDDKVVGTKPATDGKRYSLYFLHGYGQSSQKHTTNHSQPTSPTDNTQNNKNESIPPLHPPYIPDVTKNPKTSIDKEIEVSYKNQKVSYNLVTPQTEKTPSVTNYNSDSEVDRGELVTKLQEQGGGGFSNENITNLDEKKKHTTNPEDATSPEDEYITELEEIATIEDEELLINKWLDSNFSNQTTQAQRDTVWKGIKNKNYDAYKRLSSLLKQASKVWKCRKNIKIGTRVKLLNGITEGRTGTIVNTNSGNAIGNLIVELDDNYGKQFARPEWVEILA